MRIVKLISKESASLTINADLIYCQQARIPTRDSHKCAGKLLKMYEKWKFLNEVKVEKIAVGIKKKIDIFMGMLDDLFDMATADALITMKNIEDKEFLEKQRQKRRVGSMLGIDMKLASKEKRSNLRQEKGNARKLRYEETSKLQHKLKSFNS